jgi:hypothetical protein
MALEREAGFPVYDGPTTESPPGTDCPYSIPVMSRYLTDCHYHYSVEEEPTTFGEFELREKLVFSNREFWIWSCKDGFGRNWDIVVGRGETPMHGESGSKVWMTGDIYVGRHTPMQLIVDEYPEHIHETGKPN